jgi:hypothetical protein
VKFGGYNERVGHLKFCMELDHKHTYKFYITHFLEVNYKTLELYSANLTLSEPVIVEIMHGNQSLYYIMN